MVILPELLGDPQAPLLLLIQHTLQLQEEYGLGSRYYFLLCLNRFISLGLGLSFSCLLRMVELLLVELSGVTMTFQVLVVVESWQVHWQLWQVVLICLAVELGRFGHETSTGQLQAHAKYHKP